MLKMLLEIDPDGCYPIVTKDPSYNLQRYKSIQVGPWRVRFDLYPPTERMVANFLRDCPPGKLFEVVLDVARIGRGPFSLTSSGEVTGDGRLGVLGKSFKPDLIAQPGAAQTRHLRAYPVR